MVEPGFISCWMLVIVVSAKVSVVLVFVSLLLLSFSVIPFNMVQAAGEGVSVSDSAVRLAEDGLASAYQAVLDVELLGVDASDLLKELNAGAEYLSLARVAYRQGRFEDADTYAGLCNAVADDVMVDANNLEFEVRGKSTEVFWLTLTGSLVGVAGVVFASFLVWPVFKRRFIRRILEMRPEVNPTEP